MASVRSELASRIVRLIGLKRRLTRLASLDPGSDDFARSLRTLRRTDRRDPSRGIRRRWDHEQLDIDGSRLHLLRRRGGGSRAVILYLHGGGYMFGPFWTEWAAVRSVAERADADFAVLLYPRAPEHHAPRTLDVTLQSYRRLAERYGSDTIVVMGTSAGGALAVALMAGLRDRGDRQPGCAVLLSPGVDMTLQQDVRHLEDGDVMLSVAHVRSAGALYAGPLGADDPSVSPLFGDLGGLAPLHVFAGTSEILFPSLEQFVEKANAAGTTASLVVGVDQQHTWPAAPTPEGRVALGEITEIVRRCVGR